MPTAYTSILDENPEIDAKQWIMDGLLYAFSFPLVESRHNLSDEQKKRIISEYDQTSINYHTDELKKAQTKLSLMKKQTISDWIRKFSDANKKIRADNERRIKESTKLKTKHEAIRTQLEKIIKSTTSEYLRNIADFGISQLDLVKQECTPYLEDEFSAPSTFKDKSLHSCVWEVKYHKDELVKSYETSKKRTVLYEELIREIKRIPL